MGSGTLRREILRLETLRRRRTKQDSTAWRRQKTGRYGGNTFFSHLSCINMSYKSDKASSLLTHLQGWVHYFLASLEYRNPTWSSFLLFSVFPDDPESSLICHKFRSWKMWRNRNRIMRSIYRRS